MPERKAKRSERQEQKQNQSTREEQKEAGNFLCNVSIACVTTLTEKLGSGRKNSQRSEDSLMANTKAAKSTAKVKDASAVSATTTTAPRIFNFSPASGPPGTAVTIVGQNFVNVQTVIIGSKPAGFEAVSSEQIEAVVAARAKTGPVIVRTKRGKAEGGGVFAVTSDTGREGAPPVRDPDRTK